MVIGLFNSVVSCLYILSICWLLVIFVNCLLWCGFEVLLNLLLVVALCCLFV